MANTIKLKRASGSDPSASDLATGELAIRTSNCKLFSKNDSGSAIGIVAGSADTLTTARTIAGVSFDGSANISLNNNAITNGAGYLADIVSDTSPQLGGDLQSNGNDVDFADNDSAIFGTGSDMELVSDGSTSFIRADDLRIRSKNNLENYITCAKDGAVTVFHDSSKKFETTSSGVSITGALTTTGNIDAGTANFLTDDNGKFISGTAGDFEIFHDGSNSYIRETGTGSIFIEGDSNIYIGKASGGAENGIVVKPDGDVDLYHDNSKKFNTNSSGVSVTGNITVSGTVDGRDVATDGTKLDGIASGATNVSNNNQLTNGAGYITSADGGNAATLDSIDSSQFARSDTADTLSGLMTFSGGISLGADARCAAGVSSLSDGSTITVNFTSGIHHSVTLGGNRTFGNPSNDANAVGQSGSIFITQDGTGSRTASFHSDYKFVGGTAPTLSTGANAVDRLDYIIKASGVIHCVVSLDVK